MAFTETQQYALVVGPKVTGLISLVFSALVIYTVLICKEKRSKTYHRLLLGISCVDVSSSFWLGLSTWPIPEETGILWASGNTQTCTLQGFFTQFGVASSFYNASLSIFYLLVIRYGWKEKNIHRIEPFLHAIPILWGFGTAVAGLFLTLFNSANLWCWVAPYQDRGVDADLYRWVFFYGPLWLMILVVTVNLILIFQHVQKIETANERYRFGRIAGVGSSSSDVSSSGGWKSKRRMNSAGVSSSDDLPVLDDEEDIEDEDTHDIVTGGGLEDIKEGGKDEEGGLEAGQLIKEEINSSGEEDVVGATMVQVPESPSQATTVKESSLGTSQTDLRVEEQLQTTQNNRDNGLNESSKSLCTSRKTAKRRRKVRRSREVANQSLRYAGSFYLTWFALTLTRLFQAVNGQVYYPLLLIAALMTPLQGLPNFLVYLFPRFQKARKETPEGNVWMWLKGSIAPEDVIRANSVANRGSRATRFD